MATFQTKFLRNMVVAEHTMASVFEKPAGFFYSAGQFVRLRLDKPLFPDTHGHERTMSLASAPCEETLMIAMRMTGSGFKNTLEHYQSGDPITLQGPFGRMTRPEVATRSLIFLAGGIGVVPFRGIMTQERYEGFPHRVFLFASNHRKETIPFFDELSALSSPRFTPIFTLTDKEHLLPDWKGEVGRIVLPLMKKYLKGILDPIYYIVGLPEMVQDMRRMLLEDGVKKEDIFQELFIGYPTPTNP